MEVEKTIEMLREVTVETVASPTMENRTKAHYAWRDASRETGWVQDNALRIALRKAVEDCRRASRGPAYSEITESRRIEEEENHIRLREEESLAPAHIRDPWGSPPPGRMPPVQVEKRPGWISSVEEKFDKGARRVILWWAECAEARAKVARAESPGGSVGWKECAEDLRAYLGKTEQALYRVVLSVRKVGGAERKRYLWVNPDEKKFDRSVVKEAASVFSKEEAERVVHRLERRRGGEGSSVAMELVGSD